jgi:CheY-like chemotaxis protein
MSIDKKYILVVEDNLVAALAEKSIFEMLGCQVEHVDDGDKAVKLFKENHSFHGICMDIGLPTLSGVDACIAIRQYESEHHLSLTPIIAVTANNNPEETEHYKVVGMQEVIQKPLTKEKAEHFLSFCK